MVDIPSKVQTFIKRIDRTHKGLGVPMFFTHLSVLARKSAFLIGEMGTGKGTAISRTDKIRRTTIEQEWFSFTYTELASRIGEVADTDLLFKIPEWSVLSEYHRDMFLTIISHVITDHNFYKELRDKENPVINIKDCELTTLIAIQPLKFNQMITHNENWGSLSSDRFIKFCLLNPLRDDTVEPERLNLRMPDALIDPLDGESERYGYDYNTRIYHEPKILMQLFGKQISVGRKKLYARDYLRAYCQFVGDKTARPKHELELLKLFAPYISIWERMYYPKGYDIAKAPTFDIGGYRLLQALAYLQGSITSKELAKYFYLGYEEEGEALVTERSERNIRRYGERLRRMNLISITEDSPKRLALAGWLKEHFDWYRDLISVGYMAVK